MWKLWWLAAVSIGLIACTNAAKEKGLLKECKAGNPESCLMIAQMHEGSDDRKALQFFKISCSKGSTNACVKYAALIKSKSPSEAKRRLKWACDQGNTNACANYMEFLKK